VACAVPCSSHGRQNVKWGNVLSFTQGIYLPSLQWTLPWLLDALGTMWQTVNLSACLKHAPVPAPAAVIRQTATINRSNSAAQPINTACTSRRSWVTPTRRWCGWHSSCRSTGRRAPPQTLLNIKSSSYEPAPFLPSQLGQPNPRGCGWRSSFRSAGCCSSADSHFHVHPVSSE